MNIFRVLTIMLYSVIIIGGLGIGVFYSTLSEPVSYHLAAFEIPWNELSSSAQWMILNFEKSAAAGFISASIGVFFLIAYAVKHNNLWCYIGAFVVALSEWLNILTRVASVTNNTVSQPPLTLNIIAVVMICIAFIVSLLCYSRVKQRQ